MSHMGNTESKERLMAYVLKLNRLDLIAELGLSINEVSAVSYDDLVDRVVEKRFEELPEPY